MCISAQVFAGDMISTQISGAAGNGVTSANSFSRLFDAAAFAQFSCKLHLSDSVLVARWAQLDLERQVLQKRIAKNVTPLHVNPSQGTVRRSSHSVCVEQFSKHSLHSKLPARQRQAERRAEFSRIQA